MPETTENAQENIKNLSPREIVEELDKYIISQNMAKRAVAIALRNRWRRLKVEGEMRDEITPKNIIMIGPTGVGKTEIARRLAKLAQAPFYKVEASKFTEVGYVGKDVESMIRDLIEISVNMVREQQRESVREKARDNAEERLLDILLPKKKKKKPQPISFDMNQGADENAVMIDYEQEAEEDCSKTREKLREMLKQGKLDERKVELDLGRSSPGFGGGMPMIEIVSSGGSLDDISNNIRDMMGNMFSPTQKRKKVRVPEALDLLIGEETLKLIDMEAVTKKAMHLVENSGIIFIDEIDKIASSGERGRGGPDVSREGVQRDILPIVEGSTISTKYGFIRTNHILFIASGAFHISKPSDLIPELQGRFPIRVELKALKKEEFRRILTEPQNSLVKQYQSMMKTENIELKFTDDALDEIAEVAALANDQMENIGARRLHTIMERVMDELSFDASERDPCDFEVDGKYVRHCLEDIIKDQDLSQYIL
ncbi:MAG: ATP-dependent protease ATPase subunit HslU [Deltaproteobacteria bacterium]|nr:ATP-dependent protease ATPase subunit HslU [Deltaproteobacteria bacterium]